MSTTTAVPQQLPAPESIADIPGWFWPTDQRLFEWLLAHQSAAGTRGDLCELGTYLGRSAVLVGRHAQPGETFTVCDLFDSPAPDPANQAEMDRSYATLTRDRFERNYLAFHPQLPVIVQGPTSVITARVSAGSCRFVHVDASHQYRQVRGDIAATRQLLGPGGVVAFDDYRAPHTPGVAAAVWQAVTTDGLVPIWVSPCKLYAAWGEAAKLRAALLAWLAGQGVTWTVQDVAGHELVLVPEWPAPQPPLGPAAVDVKPAAVDVK